MPYTPMSREQAKVVIGSARMGVTDVYGFGRRLEAQGVLTGASPVEIERALVDLYGHPLP